jgi:hypothetical protein
MDLLVVPTEVTLNGNWLEFRYSGGTARARRVKPSRSLLTDFLTLRESTDDIVSYAKRWGPLGLCAHDQPFDQCFECEWPTLERRRESLTTWRRIIRRARWLLETGARLQRRDLDIQEREFIDPPPAGPLRFPPARPVAKTESEIQRWSEFLSTFSVHMEDSNLRLTLSLAEQRPQLVVGFRSLYGALVLQLALAITQSRGLTTCSSCREPFFPQRNWKYCNNCGRKAARRIASKHYYWRKKTKAEGQKKVALVRKRRKIAPRAG